jgi:[acyl-carrier-protein] S-malonyltransferase
MTAEKERPKMRAFVFPGQGAQAIGMGKALADSYPAARAVFEEVDAALGEALSALVWDGDIAELTLTRNAQPALMATSMAAMRALEAEGVTIDAADFVAGHSLGEYSALAAAGALSVGDTARLLRIRGTAMQEAVPVGKGAMAALLGLDFETAVAVADEAALGEVCQAANDNDPSQVVVSGHKAAVERAVDIAKEKGAKRAMLLPVSAPFHCTLMQPAADRMAEALAEVEIAAPAVPLVANVRAEAVREPDEIRDLLVAQVTGSVRWRESVIWMAAQGVTEAWEIGAGKALSGMVKRIDRSVATRAVGTPEDVAAASASLDG